MDQLVYVNYIGCEKRKLDAQRILDYLIANNFKQTEDFKNANLVIYITCAFCKEYEDWSIENIRKLYNNMKNGGILIVGGCLTSINPSRLKEFPNIIMLDVRNLDYLDLILKPRIPLDQIKDPNITCFENLKYETRKIDDRRTPTHIEYEEAKKGFKIRISYGCLGNCSYCVTRFATKSLKSKPLSVIKDELINAIQTNQKSIFITGGDTGAYGLDNSSNIVDLLRGLLSFEGDYKLYFHDFGVNWLIRYFRQLLPIFLDKKHNLRMFNFPIQSGSNKILKLMRRPYKIEDVIESLKILKEKFPEIKIGTHLIVGFPTETETDFMKSIKLIDKIHFDFLMVFKYSDNKLADSFKLTGKIDNIIKTKRYDYIMDKYYKNFYNKVY